MDDFLLNCHPPNKVRQGPQLSITQPILLAQKADPPSLVVMTTSRKGYQVFLQTLTLGHSICMEGYLGQVCP